MWLELKRSFRVLKKTMLNFILITILLAAAITVVSYTIMQSQIFSRIEVGVVVPDQDAATQTVVQFVSAMKSVKTVCDFRYMDEETAMAEMENGNLQAVILLPVNFYEDVDSGMNTPAQIFIPKNSALNVRVFQELLKDGISLLQTTEAGVYATYELMREEEHVMEAADMGDYLAEQYIVEGLSRQRLFEEQVISPFGKMESAQFYYLSVFMIVLLMSGLSMGYLFRGHSRAVDQELKLYGLGAIKRSFVKVAIMTFLLYLLSLVLFGAGLLLTRITPLKLLYWSSEMLVSTLLLCLTVSAYFYMIYGLCDNGMQGASVLFAANAAMILISGLILPSAYLPGSIQHIGNVMPLYIWSEYAREILFEYVQPASIIWLLIITGLELGIGGFVVCRRS